MNESAQEKPAETARGHDAPVTLRPTWRSRLKHIAFGAGFAHRILCNRAVELVDRINFVDHVTPGGVYVDIGSGTGHNAARMSWIANPHKVRLICIEPVARPTRKVLTHIKRRCDGPVEFIRAMGNELPLPDGHADGASTFFVLHHIPYDVQLEVLAEIRRVLKPGGKLFIWEDTPENEAEFAANEAWDRRLNFEPRSEPHFYRRADDWQTLFEDLGFTVLERPYFEEHSRRKREGTIRHTGFVLQVGDSQRPHPREEVDHAS